MLSTAQPVPFAVPFGASAGAGYIRTIPVASQISITPGAASLTDGFVPLNFVDPLAGGVPFSGKDMNGILNEITAAAQWMQSGGCPVYNATLSAAIGGYPNGAVLQKSASGGGFWISTVDNNATNPDIGGAGWIPYNPAAVIVTVPLTNTNVTLSVAQYSASIITLTGTLTGNVILYFPAVVGEWVVVNKCTGAFTVQVLTTAVGSTGYTLVNGLNQTFYSDGTNLDSVNEVAVGATILPTITSTVAANALTIGVSAQSLSFRSATAGSGAITTITATPTSLVVPSGATLGTIAATAARLVILELLNAGVAELAIVNLAGGNQLDETNLISTTAITSGATAANVIYSTTARTGVPYRVVGFIDITEATAGTWATAPTTVQGVGGQALAAMSSMGYGQTWQSFTVGSGNQRIFSTTYYNTTGKPIMVTIWQYSYLNANLTYTVNGFTVQWSGAGSVTGISDSVSFIVPPNGSYSANSATGWLELR